jgi:DNA-binding response OmpR family regulator
MPRILIIDDNDEIRAMLRLVLKQAGCVVDEASDGDEGVERFRAEPADLVITDILMPHSGLETILELTREFPRTKVIAISAGFGKEHRSNDELARTLGVAMVLAKPFDPHELVRGVKRLLGMG